jgi:Mg2+ and Co2+ transporter CorA
MNKKVTSTRQSTPDLMGNLMGAIESTVKQDNSKAIKPESNKGVVEKPFVSSERVESSKLVKDDIKQESNNAIMDAGKEKTTFNLSLKTLDALEDLWIKLRRKLKGKQRVTKTLIVEKAIEIVIADFESKSELGDLYTRLKE